AYFYASTHKVADKNGFRLRDENGKGEVIRRYRKEGITITLPEGKNLNNVKIFYVWCEDFDVNFGDVKIPKSFDYPRPQKIDPLKGVHGISSDNIVIVDAQTLLVPHLSYDGEAPDAKFWVGSGSKPSPQGIRVPDENGKEVPLRKYDRKTVVLTLPGDLTIFDIGHFGIWCEKFTVDFGHVLIPQGLNIPPSLKMLGVSPQSKLNCEVLYDDLAFEVRWAIAGESIVVQLVAKLDNGDYMAFGVSGDNARSVMIGGDVVVAWVDKETLKGFAEDYYLADKAQCSGPSGSCPDNKLSLEDSNSVKILNAAMVNGYSIVTFQRPLKASDVYDLPISTNTSQAVIWAIGPLNQRREVSFHNHYLKNNLFIDFGRPARWNCPMPENEQPSMAPVQSRNKIEPTVEIAASEPPTTSAPTRNPNRRRGGSRKPQPTEEGAVDSEKSSSVAQQQRRRGSQRTSGTSTRAVAPSASIQKREAWVIPPIMCYEPEDGVFYAQMGPTGGKKGYPAITGHVGWGISWYINGLLIPEINVVRGKTYTFVVEGGHDSEVSAKYHPFYITDDSVGGYEYKTPEERQNIRIFAGVRQGKTGSLEPTGTGRLCHWTHTGDAEADDFDSFGAYQRTLELKCDPGEPGVIQWTPDKDTPDTVYYQCFTHRYLGWKINVHDSCDGQPAASEIIPVKVDAPADLQDKSDIDLDESPSVRIETRVNPNTLFKEDKEDKEFKSTVSEKKIIPSTLDPLPSTRQPQEKLPNEPIPTPSQQNYFDPFYQNTGPYFAQLTHNPNPFDQTQHQPPQNFRPSTLLNTVHENATPNFIQEIVLSFTTTNSSTSTTPTASTTEKTTTTTERPSTTTQFPQKFTDNIAVAATDRQNLSFIMPPPVNLPAKFNTLVLRRPLGPPPGYPKRPMQFPVKMIMRPPMRQFPMQKVTYKKIYRPQQYKIPHVMSHVRPYALPLENKPMFFPHMPPKTPVAPSYFLSKPPPPTYSTQSPPIQNQMINVIVTESSRTDEIRNVEISPQQASTEREPEIQTAPSTSIMDITPTFIHPAYNTGFKPGSVKIESGFKPIVSKEFQDRMDNNEPDIEYESEMGVVNVDNADQYEFKPIQNFEPMFVPSPTDKTVKEKRIKVQKRILKKRYYPYTKIVLKRPRSLPETMEEPIAEAAERVETYYLPPSDNKNKPIDVIRKPSNIDIEAPDFSNIDSPPDVVVAYDGKKVSGQSLTAKLTDHSTLIDQRLSKASQYIKTMPQVGKFKGELPPLNPAFIDKNAPQLQSKSGVLSRDLDTPSLPSSSYLPQGLTRLSRVRKGNKDGGNRRKRAAHHTPEHTAEQEKRIHSTPNSSTQLILSVNSYLTIFMVAYFLKYL
ncbi:protein Skeletor, isoforms B/C-like, partial [Anoplophora glabripennis]|uniref:protein Skeletor, isoforms B/C-like n=1 Tax=Anoplophora glabripennis TaxID=217634 RepID=UPI0008737153